MEYATPCISMRLDNIRNSARAVISCRTATASSWPPAAH